MKLIALVLSMAMAQDIKKEPLVRAALRNMPETCTERLKGMMGLKEMSPCWNYYHARREGDPKVAEVGRTFYVFAPSSGSPLDVDSLGILSATITPGETRVYTVRLSEDWKPLFAGRTDRTLKDSVVISTHSVRIAADSPEVDAVVSESKKWLTERIDPPKKRKKK